MLNDGEGKFSSAQAITGSGPSTNVVYLGPRSTQGNSQGVDAPPIALAINQTFAGGTSLAIEIQDSVDAAFTSPRVLDRSPVFPVADLVAGADLPWWPRVPGKAREFIRMNYVVVGTMSAGALTAVMTAARQTTR